MLCCVVLCCVVLCCVVLCCVVCALSTGVIKLSFYRFHQIKVVGGKQKKNRAGETDRKKKNSYTKKV
jgi:hypothetical protein